MKIKKKSLIWGFLFTGILILVGSGALFLYAFVADYGFARQVSLAEKELRLEVVRCAEGWLGANESDGSHQDIIDFYNTQPTLPRGYEVQYDDNWCATFDSTVALQCSLTDIIPTECGCEKQIQLFMELGCWEENDSYLPLPGDLIFYAWDDSFLGDCTGWADHVGIVVGTAGPFIKVVEGNKDDAVSYRIVLRNDPTIRGYGLPDYSGKTK